MTELQAKADEGSKTGSEELSQLRQDLIKAQTEAKEKEEANTAILNNLRHQLKSLKALGRKFREDLNQSSKEKEALVKEKEALDEELTKLKTEKSLDEGVHLIEQLTEEHDKLKEKYEEAKKKEEEMLRKEARAKDVMKIAKEKLDAAAKENLELKELLSGKEARLSAREGSDIDIMKSAALVSQVKKLQEEKANLERIIAEERSENERLRQEAEASAAAATAAAASQPAPKPVAVAVAGVVQVQAQQPVGQAQPQQVLRKQVQAHVPPHRHQPRDEHRPTQTASIRPMPQQRAAVQAQAVVLPTSQVSSGQPEVATVQPTLAVSVSVSASSGPQLPSTSQQQQAAPQPTMQLDPMAIEFSPTERSTSAAEAIDTSDDHLRAIVSLRNEQPQASTSGPAHPSHTAQTSTTSGGPPTTASVPPNLKRPRETPDSDSQMSEERAGPSGIQKKARTISSTEQFGEYDQVSSGTADVPELAGVSGSQDLESDSSAQLDAELREVGSSSQMGDSVGTSFEIAASSGVRSSYTAVASSDTSGVGCSGQANSTSQEDEETGDILDLEQGTEDMEEGEISEDVEEADIAEEDELNDDQDLEPSMEQELGDGGDVVGVEEGLEASSDEEEQEEEEERDNQPAPEDVNEDNSSEPSSSTGTSQLRPSQQQQQQQQQPPQAQPNQALGIETDVGQVSFDA